MTLPVYEVYAIKYAERGGRRPEHFIGGDPHDGPMPMDYFVWLIRNDERLIVVDTGFDAAVARLPEVAAKGVRIIAPPTWALVTLDGSQRIVPSAYATAAKAAGLDIITWTLERSGPLATTGRSDYYYQSVTAAIHNDGDTFELLDVLAKRVGIRGIFSDWAGTVTYYANCMGL